MQSRTIVFASTNAGKMAEVRETLTHSGIEIIDPGTLVDSRGPLPVVEENGADYAENARLKAAAFFSWCGLSSLADDSGLEVDLLGSAPGLHTARYAGPNASDSDNRRKLLREMGNQVIRTARYRASLCLIEANASVVTSEATFEGSISLEERGQGGFGYDPIFIPSGFTLTLAELKGAGQVLKTHRILALEKLFRLA